jgi:hypothetical protein
MRTELPEIPEKLSGVSVLRTNQSPEAELTVILFLFQFLILSLLYCVSFIGTFEKKKSYMLPNQSIFLV